MTDGLVLPPGAGRKIESAGMTLKIGVEQTERWSVFEAEVAPGFDVGAHVHAAAEELFYIVDGELDLLAFEPEVRTAGDWQAWRSAAGTTVTRGGPGSLMFVPARCPHAFANPTAEPVRMLFLFAPAGHELYLAELGQLVSRGGPVDPAEIAALRARWDIEQLTPLRAGLPPDPTSPRLKRSYPCDYVA
jgi:mannose-6-phosphate isomerase-like protein (cupin superfamily)